MAHRVDSVPLLSASPGDRRALAVHRYGQPGARPRAYLQAAIHANETPGILVLHHLARLLQAADRAGALRGEVALVPFANPIGLAQNVLGSHLGRVTLDGGSNFNRGFPDLAPPVAARVADKLGADAAVNARLVRDALVETVGGLTARTDVDDLRFTLLRLAADADIVLDLHCDDEALLYVVIAPWLWPAGQDLSAELAADSTFLADWPPLFDTALSRPWRDLAVKFPGRPIPQACVSATLELRGAGDVSDALAAVDAAALLRFLVRRGVVAGEPGPLPALRRPATPFPGVEFVRAPVAGIVAYRKQLGDAVAAGETIAEIVDPAAADPSAARTPVRSAGAGLLVTRRADKLVRPDGVVGKVSGIAPIPDPKQY